MGLGLVDLSFRGFEISGFVAAPFRHIDVAFHILMKSYNQSYNTFFMLPCVAACQDQCIHLHRLTGGTKNQDTHNMRMLRLPLMINMDKREYL